MPPDQQAAATTIRSTDRDLVDLDLGVQLAVAVAAVGILAAAKPFDDLFGTHDQTDHFRGHGSAGQ
jgi:hypothetical protein